MSWLKSNWRTTAAGLVALAAIGRVAYDAHETAKLIPYLLDPVISASIVSALGLIVAGDGKAAKKAAK